MNEETRQRIIRRVYAALRPFTDELNRGSQADRFQAIGVAEMALTSWAKDELKHDPEPQP